LKSEIISRNLQKDENNDSQELKSTEETEGENKEKEKVIFFSSEEEFRKIANIDLENPEDVKLVEEKGIPFDSGMIEVDIEGKRRKMNTSKEDFGTLLTEDDDDIIRAF
jgi:hypothetical protein